MQNSKIIRIDYTPTMQEIRDVFLDEGQTKVRDESWRDENNRKCYSYELECTEQQEEMVVGILRNFCVGVLETYVNNIFATLAPKPTPHVEVAE